MAAQAFHCFVLRAGSSALAAALPAVQVPRRRWQQGAGGGTGSGLGPSCPRCPGPEPAAPWHGDCNPGMEAVVSPDSTKIAGAACQAACRTALTALAVFSRVGNVCCFWDMRYPGPEGRQGTSWHPEGPVNGSTGTDPSGGAPLWTGRAAQGGTARGMRVPMELGSMAVLV